jgi:hypothetical protein
MRRSGRGSGPPLVSYSLRFTPTEPRSRHAARGPEARPGAWSHAAIDLRSLSLTGAVRPGGTRAEGGGEGAQMGRGEGAVGGGGRIVLQVLIL